MSEPVKLSRYTSEDGKWEGYLLWCPGCAGPHPVDVRHPQRAWKWNGSMTRPTFEPSLLVHGDADMKVKPVAFADSCGASPGAVPGCLRELGHGGPCRTTEVPVRPRCHSFIRDGQIQFLGDCGHALAGKTVALPPWKGWDNDEPETMA